MQVVKNVMVQQPTIVHLAKKITFYPISNVYNVILIAYLVKPHLPIVSHVIIKYFYKKYSHFIKINAMINVQIANMKNFKFQLKFVVRVNLHVLSALIQLLFVQIVKRENLA